jgi:hypothetical protein
MPPNGSDTGTTDPAGDPAAQQNPSGAMAGTADQDTQMQSWPADRQSAYKAWPPETQTYFWSLSEDRQNIFWALSDSDRMTLSQLPEPQRETTWAQIESQVKPNG